MVPGTGSSAYFAGLRQNTTGKTCGIWEKSGGTWYERATTTGSQCKANLGEWHSLHLRIVRERIEMWMDHQAVLTWADTTVLAAGNLGLATFNGTASFDNVRLWTLTSSSRSYYQLGSQTVAERGTANLAAAVVTYLHGDHLNSVSLATDSSGALVANSTARYLPFGDHRIAPTGSPTDFDFTGERLTAVLGLVQMGAR